MNLISVAGGSTGFARVLGRENVPPVPVSGAETGRDLLRAAPAELPAAHCLRKMCGGVVCCDSYKAFYLLYSQNV